MTENMQIIKVHVPQREGDKFSMLATVGYEDKVELVLKRDFDRAIELLKKAAPKIQHEISNAFILDFLKEMDEI